MFLFANNTRTLTKWETSLRSKKNNLSIKLKYKAICKVASSQGNLSEKNLTTLNRFANVKSPSTNLKICKRREKQLEKQI